MCKCENGDFSFSNFHYNIIFCNSVANINDFAISVRVSNDSGDKKVDIVNVTHFILIDSQ